jgi:uncharacterized membrane protein YkvA (DUF1232 family)
MREDTKAELNMDEVASAFHKSTQAAEKIIKDKDKTQETLNKAMNKANKVKGALDKVWENLILMFQVVRDWISGKYKDIPVGSIIAIVAALLYFISPIDAIPDFIPGIGYIDDVFVIGIVVAQINNDLKKYDKWRKDNK